MLKTRFTELFGLQYPVVSAPMANHSGGRLAAAVSRAGGLGTFGAINPGGADWVREQVRYIKSHTERSYAAGFITAFIRGPEFDACLEEQVPVLIFSFGEPHDWLKRARDAGIRTMCQVQTLDGARQAVDLGADAIIAQGNEAGGHSGYMNTLPIVSMVLEIAPDIPVLAAGGIAGGRAMAAMLAAGADGVMLGTAFLATPEAVEARDSHKRIILESTGEDTVHTQIYDFMSGAPWPPGVGGRVRRNAFMRAWEGRESELRGRREEILPRLREGQQSGDPEVESVWVGQGAGLVREIRPAADIVTSISDEAERILRERPP
ncbi:MAG TPA: nitronate monooxygenase, partial [Dehalococcoidia bacterium]